MRFLCESTKRGEMIRSQESNPLPPISKSTRVSQSVMASPSHNYDTKEESLRTWSARVSRGAAGPTNPQFEGGHCAISWPERDSLLLFVYRDSLLHETRWKLQAAPSTFSVWASKESWSFDFVHRQLILISTWRKRSPELSKGSIAIVDMVSSGDLTHLSAWLCTALQLREAKPWKRVMLLLSTSATTQRMTKCTTTWSVHMDWMWPRMCSSSRRSREVSNGLMQTVVLASLSEMTPMRRSLCADQTWRKWASGQNFFKQVTGLSSM